jgi:hypothetical protein
MVARLVRAIWWDSVDEPPDKIVVLLDCDGKDPETVMEPYRSQLRNRAGWQVTASLLCAAAQWHLEAWFFADATGLRQYLGRDPGNVDASDPDAIRNPKLHLKNLLGDRVYTAAIAEEIARSVDARAITDVSGSFRSFLSAVRNGGHIEETC